MDYLIKSDLFRYAGNTDWTSFFRSWRIPGFRYTYFLRKVAIYEKFTIPGFIYRLFYYRYTYKYGFQIPRETTIGKGFQISHFGCIVINSKSRIGNNCYISHNVTIGQTNRGKMKGYPTLGDRVWVGAGAVIVGSVTIGSNVLIAPNAYVNFDIPDNCIVMGNPARVIPKENATQDYIVNIVE